MHSVYTETLFNDVRVFKRFLAIYIGWVLFMSRRFQTFSHQMLSDIP